MTSPISGSDESPPPIPEIPTSEQFKNYEKYMEEITNLYAEYKNVLNPEYIEEFSAEFTEEIDIERINKIKAKLSQDMQEGKLTKSQHRGLVRLVHSILYLKHHLYEEIEPPTPPPRNLSTLSSDSSASFSSQPGEYHTLMTMDDAIYHHVDNISALSEKEKTIAGQALHKILVTTDERGGAPKSSKELKTHDTFVLAKKITSKLCEAADIVPERSTLIEKEVIDFMKKLLHIKEIPKPNKGGPLITDV